MTQFTPEQAARINELAEQVDRRERAAAEAKATAADEAARQADPSGYRVAELAAEIDEDNARYGGPPADAYGADAIEKAIREMATPSPKWPTASLTDQITAAQALVDAQPTAALASVEEELRRQGERSHLLSLQVRRDGSFPAELLDNATKS
jgi:hypothetical protein